MNTEIHSSANYHILIPISTCFSFISVSISIIILIFIYSNKHLHTITYLLISNTCFSSIFYCCVQAMNYIYLIFLTWQTSNISCRFRAYFSCMSIASVVYSYFLQALSRYFFSKISIKYHRILSFKIHYLMIIFQWFIVFLIPLPSLITNDIFYRPTFLCWVPKDKLLHVLYTLIIYYLLPVGFIIIIYLNIYIRVKSLTYSQIHQNRNLEILRNIILLILIYTFGGIPTLIYITLRIEIFYSIGILTVSLTVAIEKISMIILDRELRRKFFSKKKISILPIINQQYRLRK